MIPSNILNPLHHVVGLMQAMNPFAFLIMVAIVTEIGGTSAVMLNSFTPTQI